jgi:hypothetical protein
VIRGNHGQRIPRESQEIKRDTEEFSLACGIIQPVMKFLRPNVSFILLYRPYLDILDSWNTRSHRRFSSLRATVTISA